MPINCEYDPTSPSIRPMGQNGSKKKKTKVKDNFSTMEDTLKEKMTLITEMARLKEEENYLKKRELKMKELEILLKDTSGMRDKQCQDHAILCNMITESHGLSNCMY